MARGRSVTLALLAALLGPSLGPGPGVQLLNDLESNPAPEPSQRRSGSTNACSYFTRPLLPALQRGLRGTKGRKMMEHHPSSSSEISSGGTGSAVVHASQTTPPWSEAAKEEETPRSLVDILQQAMRDVPVEDTPAQSSALPSPPNDTAEAPWLKVYRKYAKKQKSLKSIAVRRKPAPSTTPLVLSRPPDPDISAGFCVYQSPQLTAALEELAFVVQTAAAKKKTETLEQLINGFSEVLRECF